MQRRLLTFRTPPGPVCSGRIDSAAFDLIGQSGKTVAEPLRRGLKPLYG